uniref:Complement component 1 Q subcomponent-binding protein, mitochondrial n=1 Tax=Cyprinus carpio TaxID=7962 RepID=A0A8C2A8M0_CYPCA
MQCFIHSVCLLQVIKRLRSFSPMKSKKKRRSRRTRVFLKCPAAGSSSSTAQRPNSSARCPERSTDRVFHQNPALNNHACMPYSFRKQFCSDFADVLFGRTAFKACTCKCLLINALSKFTKCSYLSPSCGIVFGRVTITFNVNNSIPPQLEEDPEHTQKSPEDEPEIVSTPNFVVEVTKPGAKSSLVFDCHFPEDELLVSEQTGHAEGEEESDIFTIREVSFQPEGDTEWKETSYTLNTDSLDWALYDHLMDFLADRGVDNTFADELTELSTALEHQEYIKFLEDLSTFVKSK